jgi:dephospho-CoA kinase
MSQDIAFIGKMRSGKDTAAARLCEAHDYTRLAFADPVRELALKLDPIIYAPDETGFGEDFERLSETVARLGWEEAKQIPEVRRTLQHAGQGVRELDPSFWIFELLRKYRAAKPDPIVITDVRYWNEARTLRKRGFRLVRIVRPGATPASGSAATHASETDLDDYPCDVVIDNSGSLADLHAAVDALAR